MPDGALLAAAQVRALHPRPAAPALAASPQGSSNGRRGGGGHRTHGTARSRFTNGGQEDGSGSSPPQVSACRGMEPSAQGPRGLPGVVVVGAGCRPSPRGRRHRHPATAGASLPRRRDFRRCRCPGSRGGAAGSGGGSAEFGGATSGSGLPFLLGAVAAAGGVRLDPRLSLSGWFVARPRRRPGVAAAAATCRTWGTGSGASR